MPPLARSYLALLTNGARSLLSRTTFHSVSLDWPYQAEKPSLPTRPLAVRVGGLSVWLTRTAPPAPYPRRAMRLFRAVHNDPPTEHDMKSAWDLGMRPRRLSPAQVRAYKEVSVFR